MILRNFKLSIASTFIFCTETNVEDFRVKQKEKVMFKFEITKKIVTKLIPEKHWFKMALIEKEFISLKENTIVLKRKCFIVDTFFSIILRRCRRRRR